MQSHPNFTHFLLSLPHFILSLILSEFLSVFISALLLKMVSALLLLHQKAVAKWRLTSAAATEEGLCVFSSWGQIPLKRAKLWSTISHCNENPNSDQQESPFPITVHNLFGVKVNLSKWNGEVEIIFYFIFGGETAPGQIPTPFSSLFL